MLLVLTRDGELYVKFFNDLVKIIFNFEKPLNYQVLQQEMLPVSSLNGI
ncbi:MAG: hypothetical protein WAV23_02585 [Minisyncoccia bacterium]